MSVPYLSMNVEDLKKFVFVGLVSIAGFFSGRWVDGVDQALLVTKAQVEKHDIELAILKEIQKQNITILTEQKDILKGILESERRARR